MNDINNINKDLTQSIKCIACPFNSFPEVKFKGCGSLTCFVDEDYRILFNDIIKNIKDELL